VSWFLEQVESLPELSHDIMLRDRLAADHPDRSYEALRARIDFLLNKQREKGVHKALQPTVAKAGAVAKASTLNPSSASASLNPEHPKQTPPDPNSKNQIRKAAKEAILLAAAAGINPKGKGKGKGSGKGSGKGKGSQAGSQATSRASSVDSKPKLSDEEKATLPCYKHRDHGACDLKDCKFSHDAVLIAKAVKDKASNPKGKGKGKGKPGSPAGTPRALPACWNYNSSAGCRTVGCRFPHVLKATVARITGNPALSATQDAEEWDEC
jgi:hypothetical protein